MALRILHIVSTLDPNEGGRTAIVKQLAPALANEECDVTVVCLDAPNEEWHSLQQARVYALGWPLFRHRYSLSFRLVEWLRTNVASYDVAVVHGVWQFPLLVAALLLPARRIPFVVYAHGMLTETSIRWGFAKRIKKAVYWNLIERRTIARAAALIFTTEQERENSRRQIVSTGARSAVIRNGIEEVKRPPVDAARSIGEPYLFVLGRIHPIKGIDIALRAFASAQLSKHRLVIAGDGERELVRELKELTKKLRIDDRVDYVGMVGDDRKALLISQADALLAPSHHENFGIAIVEALSLGVPVLTTRAVGIWREIEGHSAGVLFSPEVGECAEAMRVWAGFSEQEAELMREGARKCYKANFSIDRTATELRALLASIVAGMSGERGKK